MGQDLEPIVYDGELVDETCDCGQPGQLVVDPYTADLYDEVEMVVLCDDCYRDRLEAI